MLASLKRAASKRGRRGSGDDNRRDENLADEKKTSEFAGKKKLLKGRLLSVLSALLFVLLYALRPLVWVLALAWPPLFHLGRLNSFDEKL